MLLQMSMTLVAFWIKSIVRMDFVCWCMISVVCVVVDGVVFCLEVADVVDVVIFVRVAELVVPRSTNHAFDGEQFLVGQHRVG